MPGGTNRLDKLVRTVSPMTPQPPETEEDRNPDNLSPGEPSC